MLDRSYDRLLRTGWTPADPARHTLGRLRGRRVATFELLLLIGPKNRAGASYFHAFLRDPDETPSAGPVLTGLHGQGQYPGYNWVEVMALASRFHLGSRDVALDGLRQPLLQALADIIPPGGHMMLEYDSPEHLETAQALARGVPPIATPLGCLLFEVGCGSSFTDWHFCEGGCEGPRKLQGHKALDARHAQDRARSLAGELHAFNARAQGSGSDVERAARHRARNLLVALERLAATAPG